MCGHWVKLFKHTDFSPANFGSSVSGLEGLFLLFLLPFSVFHLAGAGLGDMVEKKLMNGKLHSITGFIMVL